MAFRKLVVIPLFWGPKWSPNRTVFRSLTPEVNAVNMISGMWTVMRSWYMEGLLYYGIEPGFVHPGTKPEDAPPPRFKDDDCWNRIEQGAAHQRGVALRAQARAAAIRSGGVGWLKRSA